MDVNVQFKLLVSWILPHGSFRRREVDLASELALDPAPRYDRAARQTQASRAVFYAILVGALELVSVRREISRARGTVQRELTHVSHEA